MLTDHEEPTMAEHLILISADGHAGPPIAEFRPYVDAGLRDEFEDFLVAREAWRAERNRSMGLNEGDELVHALFGEQMVQLYTNQDAVSSGGCTGSSASDRRNAELEKEGIVAEVLFADFQNSNEPPWGAAFPFPGTNARLRHAGAQIFNRWLADFCAPLPGCGARRRGGGPGGAGVQPLDIGVAVDEVLWVREAALASVMLPTGDNELL